MASQTVGPLDGERKRIISGPYVQARTGIFRRSLIQNSYSIFGRGTYYFPLGSYVREMCAVVRASLLPRTLFLPSQVLRRTRQNMREPAEGKMLLVLCRGAFVSLLSTPSGHPRATVPAKMRRPS